MRQKASYDLSVFAEPLTPRDAVPGRIVEGALRVIARFGLAKLTLDDVAREAGCSRATLYRYFPGKGALLRAVLDSETGRLRQGLGRRRHGPLGSVTVSRRVARRAGSAAAPPARTSTARRAAT